MLIMLCWMLYLEFYMCSSSEDRIGSVIYLFDLDFELILATTLVIYLLKRE